jgi:hypothetical protein
MRIWVTASRVALSVLLIATAAYSQDTKTPFSSVPVDQRKALAKRLIDYTNAFRAKDWKSLYNLVSEVNRPVSNGSRPGKKMFARAMEDGDDWDRLLKFTPIRTEMASAGQFDVYGCGEFPSGEKDPERVAVAVRAVREHGRWFFTAWDYFDPREPCSNVSDPAWRPSHYSSLRLSFLPELACLVNVCTD